MRLSVHQWLGLFALVTFMPLNGFSKTFKGVQLPDSLKVGEKNLILNGVALRTKRILFTFDVYVAGLYLEAPQKKAEMVLKSPTFKQIDMHFLRSVSKSKITKALKEGIQKNCLNECDKMKAPIAQFDQLLPDLENKDKLSFIFYPDRVEIKMKGKKNSQGSVPGASFSQNLLAAFIGKEPPSKKFRDGLLGI